MTPTYPTFEMHLAVVNWQIYQRKVHWEAERMEKYRYFITRLWFQNKLLTPIMPMKLLYSTPNDPDDNWLFDLYKTAQALEKTYFKTEYYNGFINNKPV